MVFVWVLIDRSIFIFGDLKHATSWIEVIDRKLVAVDNKLIPHLKLLLVEELDIDGGAQVAQYIKMLINGLQVSRDIPEAGPF